MVEERILNAVERIDGAMSRIEAAVRRPAPASGDTLVLKDLRERHATMRERMEAVIAELDVLVSGGVQRG